MTSTLLSMTILVAEDSSDDRLLIEHAWQSVAKVKIHFAKDGTEVMDYLSQQDQASNRLPLPRLILLDLNMPKKNGFEVLQELRAKPNWQQIPVIVLTTSTNSSDIARSYRLGANSYVTKPDTFEELINLVKQLHQYWFRTVRLPE